MFVVLIIRLCQWYRVLSKTDKSWEKNRQASVRRQTLRKEAVEYKGGKCLICGYTGLPSVMDFHHLDPSTKEFDISSKVTKLEDLIEELQKCVLLCCRCHREVHEGLHPSYLVHEGTGSMDADYIDDDNDFT